METYSARQLAKKFGVNKSQITLMLKKGLITRDTKDDKGNPAFSEVMFERVEEILRYKKSHGGKLPTPDELNEFEADALNLRGVDTNGDFMAVARWFGNTTTLSHLNSSTLQAMLALRGVDTNGDCSKDESAPPEIDENPPTIETPPNQFSFSREEVSAPDAMTLDARADRIRKLQADVARGIIQIGFELIEAKKLVGHGNWAEWLQKEFEWSIRTAQRFMAVAQRFGNTTTLSYLPPAALQAMLTLPVGDEEAFVEEQAAAGNPVENQSAREVQSNVKKWNDEHPKEIPLFGDVPANEKPASSDEPKGEYFNATGDEKNNATVDELNGDSGTAPAEKKNSPLPVAIVIVLDETSSAAIRKCLGDGELKFFKVGTRKAFELSGDVDEIAACLIGDGIKIKIYKEENNEIQN